jgi:VirK protein
MLKKLLVASLVFISTSISAHELASFQDITGRLSLGKAIRVVINTNHCDVSDPNEYKIPKQTMVTKPASVIFTENLLSFDGSKFTLGSGNAPVPPSGLMQRGSFLMDIAGNLNLTIAFYDGETNHKSSQFKDVQIQCHLGEGLRIFKA